MQKTFCFLLLLVASTLYGQQNREFYLIKCYRFDQAAQLSATENYLQHAWLPAMHRKTAKQIGVFTSVENDTASEKKLYVLIPMSSLTEISQLEDELLKDQQYLKDGAAYINTVHNQPTYKRVENIILRAFADMPKMEKPKLTGVVSKRIYELRSYEGATEKLYQKKVDMFNKGGEIKLFKRLSFNAIFYGEVLAGSRMPNLMYMTSFDNIEERAKHWKAFGDDPEWKKLSALPEYQHTVSKIDINLLHPTSYSDL